MKYRYTAWYFRLLAFVLAAVCIAVGFLSGLDAAYCAAQGYYFGQEKKFQTTWQCSEVVRSEGWEIIDQFRRNPNYDKWDKLLEDTDLRFIIVDEKTGDVVASCVKGLNITVPKNMAGNAYLYEYNVNMAIGEKGTALENVYVCDYYFGTYTNGDSWSGYSSNYQAEEQGWGSVYYSVYDDGYESTPVPVEIVEGTVGISTSYQILFLLPKNLSTHTGDYIWEAYNVHQTLRSWSGSTPFIFAVCLAVFLAVVIFLLATAGRRPGEDGVKRSWLERIPIDILISLGVLAGVCVIFLIAMVVNSTNNVYITVEELWFFAGLCAVGAAACGVVVLAALGSCVVHLRLHNFWRSMVTVQICTWLWRQVRKVLGPVGSFVVQGLRSIGMVPRAALVILGVFLVELLLLTWLVNAWSPEVPLVLLVLFNVFLMLAVFWGIAQLRILQKAAAALADGDLDNQLDTGRMYWDFKRHGDNLNAIAGGLNKAVEQRMRSERLKTELITNVSHDIKTPLTSIVNYVDLLQKPHTEAEGIQYLEVLDRQAKRLKKLTENLVEASKASTGNLPVELQPTSVLELLNQAVEEYRDRLEAGKLEIVMALRGDLTVQADGKHMWRILDNLLNNVVKYAMAGTRVYVTAEKREDRVVIAVKNISREPLNVSADELMERFVRGDSSRTTEGSGLGLNIARSLTILQNGKFDLTVDGDFFKAEVSLPTV